MAAPTNSGESDMATEDIYLNLSPLPSRRWSPLRLTPSPPRPFLPSSNSNYSMVMLSNQSMDNPLQHQLGHEEDMVDSAPYLAGDSALLQQQLRQNWSEAPDWRPRGGIMKMNNQGFEESNMGFEEVSEETMTCFYVPPSPTDFPLYRQLPSSSKSIAFSYTSDLGNRFKQIVSVVLSDEPISEGNINSAALEWVDKVEEDVQHIFEDKSSWFDAIKELGNKVNDLDRMNNSRMTEGFRSYVENNVNDLDRIIGAEGMMREDVVLLVQNILQLKDIDEPEVLTIRTINWFEQHEVDIVDQPVFEMVGQVQQLIHLMGGELDFIPGRRVCTINGVEHSDGQDLPMTTEPSIISQTKFAMRVWLGYGGQWVIEMRMRHRSNALNIGSFTTMEDDTIPLGEVVMRYSGWMDRTGFPGLLQTANKSKLPLQLPPPAQEEKPDEDFGLVCCNARGNDEIETVGTGSEGTWDCVMAHQARLNLGKRKTKEKNPGGDRRNKKTNGVLIAIPPEDILQTKRMRLKDVSNHLEGGRSTLEHNLISCPNETPAVVEQEGIPQLNSDTLPSDQALAATVGTNSVVVKDILQPQFSLTDRQDNPDDDFGKDEVEAVGMVGEGTREGKMEKGQLNSGCLEKGKRKEETSGDDKRNKKTNGVKIAISLDDILQAEGMLLEDATFNAKAVGIEAEAVGMGSGGTGKSDMGEGQLNSRYLGKEKRNEMTTPGERRNKKKEISLEDILRCKEMPQKVAAKHLKVGLSTLKRACRGHGIPIWPPCGEHNQSRPNQSPVVVDKEPIPQLNSDTLLPSNQVSATIGTGSVTVKASFGTVKMKFQLSCPWRMAELKQEVDKRLEHEAGNYHITYKDEDNDYILIACDEDLQGHISRSSLPGTNSIEVFLKPK